MKLRKIIGYLFFIFAILGVVFSLLGIYQVWMIRPRIISETDGQLKIIIQALETTQDGLAIVDQSLQTSGQDVVSIKKAIDALASSVESSDALLDSLSKLTGDEIPKTVQSTQASLTSAQTSAQLIDDILGALTQIPLLPLDPYKPDVPLHTSLKNVSTSLDTLPKSMKDIHDNLETGRGNLETMKGELKKISTSINKMGENLAEARNVVKQYQDSTTRLKSSLESAQQNSPQWINGAAWVLTFLLSWFFIFQFILFYQAVDFIGRK